MPSLLPFKDVYRHERLSFHTHIRIQIASWQYKLLLCLSSSPFPFLWKKHCRFSFGDWLCLSLGILVASTKVHVHTGTLTGQALSTQSKPGQPDLYLGIRVLSRVTENWKMKLSSAIGNAWRDGSLPVWGLTVHSFLWATQTLVTHICFDNISQ